MSEVHRALRVAALAVGVVWLPVILLWGPLPHALTWDDAWYYFEIGRNVADGAGSTFDGFNTTNGYHPLWLGVSALAYLVGLDELVAVRALLVLQLAMWVGTLLLLGRVVGVRVSGWPALEGFPAKARHRCTAVLASSWFLLGANPYVVKLFVNGLETGLVAVLSALLLALALDNGGDPLRRPMAVGAVLGLAFLARTDAVLIAAALLLWSAVLRRRIDRTVLAVGAVFSVVVLAYLASNVALVGHPMQISGVVKRTDAAVVPLTLLGAVAAAVFLAGLRSRGRTLRLRRAGDALGETAWYGTGAVLIVAYDHGLTAEVYLWHYAPLALWLLLLAGHAVADLLEGAVAEAAANKGRAADKAFLVGAILAVPFLGGALWQLRSFTDPGLRSLQEGDRAAAEWIAANLPADAVVASYDAGVIGYFAERPVVNLDGLVNSFEWRDAKEAGPAAIRAFLEPLDVGFLANHGEPVDGDDPALIETSEAIYGAPPELLHRVEFEFCGSAGGATGCRPYAAFVYELPSSTGS